MRRYETVFIIDPDASAERRTAVLDRVNSEIEKYQGVLLQHDEWGLRKMAYPIKKKPRGYYVLTDYCGNGEMVSEIERFFKIDDSVIRFMTVQTAEDVDPEQAKAELEAKKSQAAAETETEEATAFTADAVAEQQEAEAKAGEPEMDSDVNADVADFETAEQIDKEDE